MLVQEAIQEYKGTVIAVSHDRYFIKQIVNRVIEVKDGYLQDYVGDYDVSLAHSVIFGLLCFNCLALLWFRMNFSLADRGHVNQQV